MRVIIVEDEALLAIDLTAVVEGAGHEVVCCEPSAETALRCAEEHGADLALLNIALNEGPRAGLDLAARLLSAFGIPSIIVSSQRADANDARTIALGYLPKPYTGDDILGAIEVAEALRNGATPPPPSVPPTLELF